MELKSNAILLIRMAIGLCQGIALYLLFIVARRQAFLDPLVVAPLLAVWVFVPVVAIASIGNLRVRTLAVWIVAVTLVCAALAFYDIYRDPFEGAVNSRSQRFTPSIPLWIALSAGLFIAQSLVVSADADRAPVASYPRHFEVSWKYSVQFELATLFVGLFWALFALGAALFSLIGVTAAWHLLAMPSFIACATAVALAVALHVTDVRPGMVRGARTLKLVLLSWLLPIMAAFALLFVLALPLTGLETLWGTKRATLILVAVCASLIVLINAAYQDGRHPQGAMPRMGGARAAATAALVPLVAIAGYALFLRVEQYGFTPQRVVAAAAILVVACYAAGYLLALLRSGLAQRWLEWTNVAAAYLILGVLAALFSPVADPARISVASQLHRLASGAVEPEKFDFAFLRFQSGRYGRIALEQLAAGDSETDVTNLARTALQQKSLREMREPAKIEVTPEIRAANILTVHPQGATLPDGFVDYDWNARTPHLTPSCLTTAVTCTDDPRAPGKRSCTPRSAQCEAIVADIDGDGSPEVLIVGLHGGASTAFKAGDNGEWTALGRLHNASCVRVRDGLRDNDIATVDPTLKELEINGQRIQVINNCMPPARTARPRTP